MNIILLHIVVCLLYGKKRLQGAAADIFNVYVPVCQEERYKSPYPSAIHLTCSSVFRHALQELREIHNKQQRQKQKELGGDLIQPPLDSRPPELQDNRCVWVGG